MRSARRFFLDDHDASRLLPPAQLASDREADDASADDEKIAGFHRRPSAARGSGILNDAACYSTCFDATFENPLSTPAALSAVTEKYHVAGVSCSTT